MKTDPTEVAFPAIIRRSDDNLEVWYGCTKREKFAEAALIGTLADHGLPVVPEQRRVLAKMVWDMADAMIETSGEGEPPGTIEKG